MSRQQFSNEYEIKASVKLIYPYLSTASGLEAWFADKVTVKDNVLSFAWEDGESLAYKIVQKKRNKLIKLELLISPKEPSAFILMELQTSDLTKMTYLTVTDHSSDESLEALDEIWGDAIYTLKDTIGG